jgi:hypothetical protein
MTLNIYDGLVYEIQFLFKRVVPYRCNRFEKRGSKYTEASRR